MDLEMIRGDTYILKYQRKDFDGEVIKKKPDKMWFTVKKNYKTSEKAIEKTLEDENIFFNEDDYYYRIILEHEDTKDLKYKTYVFDVQVETDNIVQTICLGTITLTNEVTFEGGNAQ